MVVDGAGPHKRRGVDVPLLVGGAALSETFTPTRIATAYGGPTFYAKDAMAGLRVMNELTNPAVRQATISAHTFSEQAGPATRRRPETASAQLREAGEFEQTFRYSRSPNWDRHVEEFLDLA